MILISTKSHILPTSDPLDNVSTEHQKIEFCACWSLWWGHERLLGPCMTMTLFPRKGPITPGQATTIRNYVAWMRELGYDARLTAYNDGVGQPANEFTGEPAREPSVLYGVDLCYTKDDLAGFIFIGFNLIRFLTNEFWYAAAFGEFPADLTAREYFGQVFSKCIINSNHMPFRGYMDIPNAKESVKNHGVVWCKRLGYAFFDWFVEVITTDASTNKSKMGSPSADRKSGLEWSSFVKWLSMRDSMLLNESAIAYVKSCNITPVFSTEKDVTDDSQTHTWDRPRDSRGRFVSRKAGGTGPTVGVIGKANAGILRVAGRKS